MALQVVNTEPLGVDAAAFTEWAQELYQIWDHCYLAASLRHVDFGDVDGMAEFEASHSEAVAGLSAFLVGDDTRINCGGVGVLEGFTTVLLQTQQDYIVADEAVGALMTKYGLA